MPIYAVIGGIGSGKTLTATYLCYKGCLNGRKIYTNIGFRFKSEKLSKSFFTNYSESGKQINDCIVFLDEAYIYLDSRMGMTEMNKTLSYFILQTRKKNVTLIITTQHIGQVDLRLRNNLDGIIYPKLYKNFKNSGVDVCKYAIQYPSGKNKTFMFKANPIYEQYDTKEVVAL